LRNYSLDAILRCLALEKRIVVVTRNKRTGHITSAQFLPLPLNSRALEGNESIRKTAHLGQHYSYAEQVDNAGHHAWRFAKFLFPRDLGLRDAAAFERVLQSIFRSVQLSCLVRPERQRPDELDDDPTFRSAA
jgi:hypothetical protein